MKKGIIKLIYKKGAGGGSGAGAALTKLAESSQALYAAVVFNVLGREMTIKDVTKENFVKASGSAITDEKFDSMVIIYQMTGLTLLLLVQMLYIRCIKEKEVLLFIEVQS